MYQPYHLSDPAEILQVMTGHHLYLSETSKIYYKNQGTGPSPRCCCCSWSHKCYLSSPFSNAHLRDLLCLVGLTPLPPSSVYVVLVSLLFQFLVDSYYQQRKIQEMLGFHTHSSLASLPAALLSPDDNQSVTPVRTGSPFFAWFTCMRNQKLAGSNCNIKMRRIIADSSCGSFSHLGTEFPKTLKL